MAYKEKEVTGSILIDQEGNYYKVNKVHKLTAEDKKKATKGETFKVKVDVTSL